MCSIYSHWKGILLDIRRNGMYEYLLGFHGINYSVIIINISNRKWKRHFTFLVDSSEKLVT